MWQSADPILGKYLPSGDNGREKNLPGRGGVYNSSNLAMYSYGSNNPVRFFDPDGNLSAEAVFVKGRQDPGTLTIRDDFGNVRLVVPVLGRGTGGRDQMKQNADTPTGTYRIGKIKDTSSWSQDSYGSTAVELVPESGVAKESGRSGLLIHGGREANTNSQWDKNYNANHPTRNGLRATHGCARVCNDDQADIVSTINDIRAERGTVDYQVKSFLHGLFGSKPDQKDTLTVRDVDK